MSHAAARTALLDIGKKLTSSFMTVKSSWRNTDRYPVLPLPRAENGVLRTDAGSFRVKEAPEAGEGCISCALIGRGFLEKETQKPLPRTYKSAQSFRVGRKVRNVGLLLADEMLPRLCRAAAAEMAFLYADGEEKFVLRGGDQLGGLFKNYAAEAAAAKVLLDGMRNSDFASVLWYPADGERLLREIRIRAILHDCQIAVLGVSLMT